MIKPKIVITGAAGFIGMHLCELLTINNFEVVGIDNYHPSYGGKWSYLRGEYLQSQLGLNIHNLDLSNENNLGKISDIFLNSEAVFHLAAWPGVRFSQSNPFEYGKANLNAFGNILEAVRISNPRKFFFASSSSIYGDLASNGPVYENSATGNNLKSFYAATKWSNELLAEQHQRIIKVPSIALRFFTVFGEFGRPDMAYWSFLENTVLGKPVTLYGQNGGSRNYTYVKDAVTILCKLLECDLKGYQALNISCGEPIQTIEVLNRISALVDKKPKIEFVERPSVDVEKTWADLSKIQSLIGVIPQTPINQALNNFVNWYLREVHK